MMIPNRVEIDICESKWIEHEFLILFLLFFGLDSDPHYGIEDHFVKIETNNGTITHSVHLTPHFLMYK